MSGLLRTPEDDVSLVEHEQLGISCTGSATYACPHTWIIPTCCTPGRHMRRSYESRYALHAGLKIDVGIPVVEQGQ